LSLAESDRPSGIPLSDRQKIAWLRLIRSDNVGPATFRDLINHFGSAEAALEVLPALSRRGGAARSIRIASIAEAERELEAADRFGATFLGIGEPGYPAALRRIDGAPPLLAVKGDVSVTAMPAVAMVGARNASISGCKFAALLAREIGAAGYAIASGLARGIDAAAHAASLGRGTIAAMAGGLDCPYPPENLDLYRRICEGEGLAISEMPFGWEPRARDFPRRNRLIAGVSLGLIVVEAAERSGSLISARRAADSADWSSPYPDRHWTRVRGAPTRSSRMVPSSRRAQRTCSKRWHRSAESMISHRRSPRNPVATEKASALRPTNPNGRGLSSR